MRTIEAITLILLASLSLTILSLVSAQQPESEPAWKIKGELTEACTCNVPCTCNFGENPSPYNYCWAMWSYWVKEGKSGDVNLAGMKIGGVEGERGTLALLSENATPQQRPAMEQIWHSLSGRLLCHVRLWPLKAAGDALDDPNRPTQGSVIRTRYVERKFLGFEYISIEQTITERGSKLIFADRGGFEAHYIFGRDPTQPVTVKNIVSWPIAEGIKAKTAYFKYKDRFQELDYRGTNANQGSFEVSNTDAGSRAMTAPR